MQASKLRISDWICLVVAGFGLALLWAGPELAVNYSESIPRGLYLVKPEQPGRGDYTLLNNDSLLTIAFRRGYLPRHIPIGKKVVAAGGDTVDVQESGVWINDLLYPNSKPLDIDSRGQAMPKIRGRFILAKDQIFLLGEHPHSFDGRYFGPVSIKDSHHILSPFFTLD